MNGNEIEPGNTNLKICPFMSRPFDCENKSVDCRCHGINNVACFGNLCMSWVDEEYPRSYDYETINGYCKLIGKI